MARLKKLNTTKKAHMHWVVRQLTNSEEDARQVLLVIRKKLQQLGYEVEGTDAEAERLAEVGAADQV